MKLNNLRFNRRSGFTLVELIPGASLFVSKEKFNPREEVIAYATEALRKGSVQTGHPYNDRLIREIRKGSAVGKEFYAAMEFAYSRKD